jgi:hypothetical protein
VTARRFIIRRQKSSVAQERSVAKDVGGRRVAGSGSLPGNKGDVREGGWLIECKQTVTARFSLTLGLWRKIYGEAVRSDRRPAMVIELSGRRVVVLDYDDFLAMRSSLDAGA